MNKDVEITHNFNSRKFKWLYAKYSIGVNPSKHCTNAIRGRYSKKFNKNNPAFNQDNVIVMDEFPELGWDAIYVCGVSTNGYAKHENYIHNVHFAIIPIPGERDEWCFEEWKVSVVNGKFEQIIDSSELPMFYSRFPREYVTCRMFRWAVNHYLMNEKQKTSGLIEL